MRKAASKTRVLPQNRKAKYSLTSSLRIQSHYYLIDMFDKLLMEFYTNYRLGWIAATECCARTMRDRQTSAPQGSMEKCVNCRNAVQPPKELQPRIGINGLNCKIQYTCAHLRDIPITMTTTQLLQQKMTRPATVAHIRRFRRKLHRDIKKKT